MVDAVTLTQEDTVSHIVKISAKIRDAAALAEACKRLGLAAPVSGSHKVYRQTVSGLAVKLPGWSFPVVVDTTTGEVHYDNYGGVWGDQSQLDRLKQSYAVAGVRLSARRSGHSVTETILPDGSIRLNVQVQGGGHRG